MKYKKVVVYSGYSEFSITNSTEFEFDGSLHEAAKFVEKQAHAVLRRDADAEGDDLNILEQYIKEFFTGVRCVDGIGFVSTGEEDITLVIPQDNEWYSIVDDESNLYTHHMPEWLELFNNSVDYTFEE